MAYNATDWATVNSTADLLSIANTNTGGYFWVAMLIMTFCVFLITLAGTFGWEAGLLTASFITLLLGILLVYLNLVSMQYVGIFVAVIVLMIIYLMWANRND